MGSWFIRHTAVAQRDGDHRACHMDIGAQRNHEIADLFGYAVILAHSRLTGIVAAEDWVPRAVVYPGIWFLIRVTGFFLLMVPAMIN